MARVTVEDCIDKVDNRFDLVLLAAHRARMISSGSQLTVDRDNDKNPVVSLREIADRRFPRKICARNWFIPCRNSSRSTSLSPIPCP